MFRYWTQNLMERLWLWTRESVSFRDFTARYRFFNIVLLDIIYDTYVANKCVTVESQHDTKFKLFFITAIIVSMLNSLIGIMVIVVSLMKQNRLMSRHGVWRAMIKQWQLCCVAQSLEIIPSLPAWAQRSCNYRFLFVTNQYDSPSCTVNVHTSLDGSPSSMPNIVKIVQCNAPPPRLTRLKIISTWPLLFTTATIPNTFCCQVLFSIQGMTINGNKIIVVICGLEYDVHLFHTWLLWWERYPHSL